MAGGEDARRNRHFKTDSAPLRLLQNAFLDRGVRHGAEIPLFRNQVTMVRDPLVDPVTDESRDKFRHCQQPPRPSQRPRQLDGRIAAIEDFSVGFPQQDHRPALFVGIFSEAHLSRQFPLKRGKFEPFMLVQPHSPPDGFRTERAIAIEKQHPTHDVTLTQRRPPPKFFDTSVENPEYLPL